MSTETPPAPAPVEAPVSTPPPAPAGDGRPRDSIAAMRTALRRGIGRGVAEAEAPPAPAPIAPQAPTPPPEPEPKAAPQTPAPETHPAQPPAEPAVPPVEDDEVKAPKGMPKEGVTALREMGKQLKETKGERDRLREENKKLREAAPAATPAAGEVERLQAQLQQVTAERDNYRTELSSVDLERTPEFRKTYSEPIRSAENQIRDISKAAGISERDAIDIANEPDASKRRERIKALTADLDDMDRSDIRSAIETLAVKKNESQRVLADAQSALTMLETDRKARQERETKAKQEKYDRESDAAFAQAYQTLTAENPLFQKREGNDEWNAMIDKLRDVGVKIDRDPAVMGNPTLRAELIYKAVGFELTCATMAQREKAFQARETELLNENKGLKETLARYVKGTPNAGGATPPDNTPPPADENLPVGKRMAKRFDQTRPR